MNFYWDNVNDATAVYPFNVATDSFTVGLYPDGGSNVVLGTIDASGNFTASYTEIVLSAAVTPRFGQVSAMVAALPTIYDRHNTDYVNSYNGQLLPAGLAELGARLDAIANVVGRY